MSLIDDFYNSATHLISSRSLNVEFILDGGATPAKSNCLISKWKPWVSTWISYAIQHSQRAWLTVSFHCRSPLLAFFGDSGKGYERFQVYDEFANSYVIKGQAALNFGKFSNVRSKSRLTFKILLNFFSQT